jgi:hypothetical protein
MPNLKRRGRIVIFRLTQAEYESLSSQNEAGKDPGPDYQIFSLRSPCPGFSKGPGNGAVALRFLPK